MKHLKLVNRILLGLVMLIPGIMKLFVLGPTAVTAMLAGFSIPAAGFLAWILILSEIVFGTAILANWKLKYTVWPPIIILVVAAFTAMINNIAQILVHIALASNYWLISSNSKK